MNLNGVRSTDDSHSIGNRLMYFFETENLDWMDSIAPHFFAEINQSINQSIVIGETRISYCRDFRFNRCSIVSRGNRTSIFSFEGREANWSILSSCLRERDDNKENYSLPFSVINLSNQS